MTDRAFWGVMAVAIGAYIALIVWSNGNERRKDGLRCDGLFSIARTATDSLLVVAADRDCVRYMGRP